jgi:hypothetical protein
MTSKVSYKRQQLLALRERLDSPPYFDGFRIAYVFCVLYVCVFALCLVYQMLSMFASSDLSNVYLQDC